MQIIMIKVETKKYRKSNFTKGSTISTDIIFTNEKHHRAN